MTEHLETLLRYQLVLSLVPILVGIGVTNLAINVRAHRAEVKKMGEDQAEVAKDVAVLKSEIANLKGDVDRLQTLHNQESH